MSSNRLTLIICCTLTDFEWKYIERKFMYLICWKTLQTILLRSITLDVSHERYLNILTSIQYIEFDYAFMFSLHFSFCLVWKAYKNWHKCKKWVRLNRGVFWFFFSFMQVRVLFRKELDKVYDPNEPVDDMREREEEMERMREHVFKGKPHWLNSNFDKFWYLSPQMKSDKDFGVIFDQSSKVALSLNWNWNYNLKSKIQWKLVAISLKYTTLNCQDRQHF